MTTADNPNGTSASVDDVLITAELARRPSRPPDYAAENRALTTLAQEMAANPGGVLQRCAELVLELCQADSAGISLLEPGGGNSVVRGHAIASGLAGYLGGTVPQDVSLYGAAIARNRVLLFNEADQVFPDLKGTHPRGYETLLAPWHNDGEFVGVLWAIKHPPEGQFDAEDARLLQSLARFAAAAHRMVAALEETRSGREELEQRVEDRTRPLSEAYDSVRASETRFRTALEIETVGVIYLDPEGQIIDANEAFLAMGGYSREAVETGRLTWQGLTPPEWIAASERAIAELKATGRTTPYEKEYFRKDGSRWWALFAAKRLPDDTIFEFVLDLTARRQAEERLEESEERFRSLVESWAQAVWETDAEGRVITDSPSWRAYTGQSLEEWLGTGWADAIHPDDRAAVQRVWCEAVRERRPLKTEHRLRRAGGWRWTKVHAAPLFGPGGSVRKWVGMNIDITERKEAEEALRTSEERFQYAARATRDIIWDIDLVADRVWWSDAMQTQMGYAPGDIGPDTAWCFAHMHPEDRERVVRGMREAAAGTRDTWSDEFRYQRADRSYATIADRGFILRDARGKAVRMIGAMQDISVRKQAEEALRASEERQVFLLKLSDALRPLEDAHEIQRVASRVLRDHLGGNRVVYWEAVSDEEMAPAGADYAADATQYNGTYRLSDYGPDLAAAYRAGHVVSQDDPASDPHLSDTQRRTFAADRIGGWASVPLVKKGHQVALLAATFPGPHTWSPPELSLMEEVAERTWAAVERARAETAWRRFAALAEASGEFIGMCDVRLVPFYVNTAGLRLVGLDSLEQAQHTPVLEFFFPEDQALIRDEFLPWVLRQGRGEIEIRFRHFQTGEALWVIYSVVALTDEHGRRNGYGTVTRDITERKQAEEALRTSESRARLLLGELQHRVRNTLSVIRSITRRTAETSHSVEDYAMHLDGRINAFARVQTAVARDPAAGLDLTDLVADELLTYVAHDGEQVRIIGPAVRLKPKAAETFGLAIHELATNAVKHGALSVPDGRIRVTWRVHDGTEDPPRLVFEWKESGTPERAAKRKRRGFGTDLLERTLTYELKAKTVQTFEPDGLRCTIELPMTERIVLGDAATTPEPG
jgi:PAS domain S-box-containing protein